MSRKPVWLLMLFVCATAAAQPQPGSQHLAITFGSQGPVAEGASPGDKVVCFGLLREVASDDVVTIRSGGKVVTDTDGDGKVPFELGRPAPQTSIWVAVDLKSGNYDAASPQGFKLKKVKFRGRGLQQREDGRGSIQDIRPFVELLVVRPGVGAWTQTLGDGAPGDEDGVIDGRLEATLDRMEPLGDSPAPPETFEKDDVVVLIDPNAMELVLVKTGESK